MRVDLQLNRKSPWACLEGVPRGIALGQVWLPGGHLQLSQEAGRVLREYFWQRGDEQSGDAVVRHAPRELLRYLGHQLRPHLRQSFRLTVRSGDVKALVAAAVAASAGAERNAIVSLSGLDHFGS